MGQSNKPLPMPMLGLDLGGNPTERPWGSASVCDNFRVMPGGWLRLRGGHKARMAAGHQDIIQFMPAKINSLSGYSQHLIHYETSAQHDVQLFDVTNWTSSIVEFCGSNISAGALIPYAIANEWVVYGNGYGEHNSLFPSSAPVLNSVPYLSYWKPGQAARFFGLYPALDSAFGAALSITYTGTPAYNTWPAPGLDLYVGLYNTATGHYSNANVQVLGLTTTGTQKVTISGLQHIRAPWHTTAERDEIKLCFYATAIGGKVAHLILNAAGDGPYTAALGSTSVSLSVFSGDARGFLVDTTKERPVNNFPPRQMRSMCFAGGRLFGILRPEGVSETKNASWYNWNFINEVGSVTWPPFEYETKTSDLAGIVWSNAQGDLRAEFTTGDPLQCWPPINFSPTPSGERPLAIFTAPNDIDVIVWTATQTYLVREQADGLMEWTSAAYFGIKPQNLRTPARSQYGVLWVNNFNQVALLDNALRVRIISGRYDAVLRSATVSCGAYFKDPLSAIDRYHIFYGSARALVHDFGTNTAYTETRTTVTAATQVPDATGAEHMLISAKVTRTSTPGGLGCDINSIEAQADQSYRIPTTDEYFDNAGTTKVAASIPDATLETNWSDFGEFEVRKDIDDVSLVGDGELAASISQNALSGEVFFDYQEVVADSGHRIDFEPASQQASILNYVGRLKLSIRHALALKLRLVMKPHASDTDGYYKFPSEEGGLARNFYGSIMRLALRISGGTNRT